MFIQLAIGTVLLLASILMAGISFWLLERVLVRLHGWLAKPPHGPKMMLVLCIAAAWILAQLTAGVWLWALTLLQLDVFVTLEEAVYFALVAFTTLGFGDILLPQEWRLLSGLAATNGLLNIGLVTAFMVETLRHIRSKQRKFSDE